MSSARTPASHRANTTAKIATTGPLRLIHAESLLDGAGEVAAMVVMVISLGAPPRRGRGLGGLPLPIWGAGGGERGYRTLHMSDPLHPTPLPSGEREHTEPAVRVSAVTMVCIKRVNPTADSRWCSTRPAV